MKILASLLFIATIYSQSLLAEDVISGVVDVKQNEENITETTKNNNSYPISYTVTVSPITKVVEDENLSAKPSKKYYEEGEYVKKQIDCAYSTSFSDFVACEGLKTQNSVDSSTEYIMWATIAAATFSGLAFIAAAISVIFIWKTLKESRRVNTLQLQPWLTIGRPIVSKYVGRIPSAQTGDASFRIEIPITNDGKTPVKGMKIDVSYINVQLRNARGDRLHLKSITSSQDRTMPLNPAVSSHQIILCSCRRVSDHIQPPPTSNFIGDDIDILINIGGDIRFIDISTPKGRLRRINFVFDNVHNNDPIDQFRVSDAIEEKDSSYFCGNDKK